MVRLAVKPSFRDAFAARRCLIPASGYYEWERTANRRLPYYIEPNEKGLFAFAGIWERWRDQVTASIVTTTASPAIAHLHPRMPMVLPASAHSAWLGETTPVDLAARTEFPP